MGEALWLTSPLPEGPWVKVRDTFGVLCAVNMSHVASTACFAPDAKADDGTWTLFVIRNPSRLMLMRLLLAMDEHGSHKNLPGVEFFRARAFRVTPEDTGAGVFSMDGEAVACAQIQYWPAQQRGILLGEPGTPSLVP
eukprot:NODE_5416_length_583_cov_312.585227.p1 GENE.NODE_5416_length_583_cov_312.585227~~NODE_5416_length_583_cov_312.585227.p1  ORF type:complete len:138 (+),score=34.27 NODE_5416_length_583_cov_312.585227:3-416(+)